MKESLLQTLSNDKKDFDLPDNLFEEKVFKLNENR